MGAGGWLCRRCRAEERWPESWRSRLLLDYAEPWRLNLSETSQKNGLLQKQMGVFKFNASSLFINELFSTPSLTALPFAYSVTRSSRCLPPITSKINPSWLVFFGSSACLRSHPSTRGPRVLYRSKLLVRASLPQARNQID